MQDTTSRAELRAFWSRHVERFRASGMSKAAYCRQYDLSYHQMVYWSSKASVSQPRALMESPSRSAMLVPVSVAPSTRPTQNELTIRLPTGVVITGINAGTVGLLESVIGTL